MSTLKILLILVSICVSSLTIQTGNTTIDDILEALKVIQSNVRDLQIENNDRKMDIALLQDTDFMLQLTTDDLTLKTNDLTIKTDDLESSHQSDVIEIIDRIDKLNVSPIGSIVAWSPRPESGQTDQDLPKGWVRCDGSVIPEPSIWAGSHTPDLNNGRRFLRGASDDSQVLQFEEDQLQDHTHADEGHTHIDAGHGHLVTFAYLAVYDTTSNGFRAYSYPSAGNPMTSQGTNLASANIQTSQANIGIPNSGSHGGETRPKNMAVIWIMRVF